MSENTKFRSSDNDEADMAMSVITIFLQEYPKEMSVYLFDIQNLVHLVNDKIKNMDTKSVALGVLPSLVKIAKLKDDFDYTSFGKQNFAYLWEIFTDETDSSYKSDYCYNLQQILQNGGEMFSDEELHSLLAKMEEEIRKSEERR